MTPIFFLKKEIKELCKSSLANETVFELKTEKYNCKQSSSIAERIPLQSKTIISHMQQTQLYEQMNEPCDQHIPHIQEKKWLFFFFFKSKSRS